jgi:PAS domain S-box-containing protein
MPAQTKDTSAALSLSDLSQAIGELRGACGKLETSMTGVNSELDETNQRLAKALESRQATLAYLESILSAIPSGVVVVDRQGRIVLFNQAAEALTGFAAADVKGRSYSGTLGDGISQKQTPLYTLATGAWTINEEKVLTTRSGGQVPVSFSTSLIVDDAGRLTGAVEVLTDLSRVKLLEEEVARVRTLATIGEVAAEVAHEVRNPLGGIKGFASLLRRDLEANPRALALVDRILEGIESLERIVGDLLDAGKPATLALEHVDLARELGRIVEIFDMAARGEGKNIIFETAFSEEPFYCRVDRVRLTQAVTNLLRNAADAVGDRGRVTVRAYAGSAGAAREESPVKPVREYLTIEVADTGPGVADDVIDKIFSPFFTTKSQGTGLGLAAVRRVAALHGGEVRYRESESGGSRFLVEIPRR